MTHYILLKIKSGYLTDELYQRVTETYTQVGEMLDGVDEINVFQNCVERDSNADFMIRMEVRDQAALEAYLKHPLHREFAQYMDLRVAQRTTFDATCCK